MKNAEEFDRDECFDAVVVGAGFAGLYMLYRLRGLGMRVRVYEAGDDVGGTWYWNRYPGARCDAESLAYSYSFSSGLEQEWEWTERYATQPEILRYIEHVADRLHLRPDIRFGCRVSAAHYDDAAGEWNILTNRGDRGHARVLVMATGCLSVPLVPDIPGLGDFSGRCYQASLWPHEGVNFGGQRVGIIGTGSSAVQAIPMIAKEAEHLFVFQRTPNFSVPAQNVPLNPDFVEQFKANYRAHRHFQKRGLTMGFGDTEVVPRELEPGADPALALSMSNEAFAAHCDGYWKSGGAFFMMAAGDVLIDEKVNRRVVAYVHDKIREIVKDPATAEALCPRSHPIGSKRICVDTDYYKTYNRTNVTLIDLRKTAIERITKTGIETETEHFDLDTLVLATGFDAMTGALDRIDIRGAKGVVLRDKWRGGPRTYLGLMTAGFPNLFTVTGPGSPSVLTNMIVSIEQHVDFITDCLEHMNASGVDTVEPKSDAEEAWVAHVNDVASETLFPKGGSWYLGANVPGKPRVFMPYAGGVGPYREVCEDVVRNGYRGFAFTSRWTGG